MNAFVFLPNDSYSIQTEHNDVRRFSGIVAGYLVKWTHKESLEDVKNKIALIKN